ncbi:hypothetical protein SASPL_129155 [Salvia splendens]|uniref:VQ domain-containing protein n=1 Tax=Salvia splendens TaxID=180675 RepID=A0A8X8XC99_SALSN|nr:uncharacterized protein LOC121752689 [Salvia splendens]KAG6411081.1 hypothetical protein SASPL_129155 [Salvia splendens]
MERIPKKTNKSPKIKKRQPLKVVYITNPIKFEASALEFRSLVQELTGQDADVEAVKAAAAEDNVHAASEEGQVSKLGQFSGKVVEWEESDLAAVRSAVSGYDEVASPMMVEGISPDLFDFLQNLDAM